MKVLTSYKYYQDKQDCFPVIPLIFLSKERKVRSMALIDSGASISVFGEETANLLGINIEDGKKTTMRGVIGRIVGYIHKVKVKVAAKTFICPIFFSREFIVSYNLLGREVFFEKFKITFDESQKRVILQ